MSENSPVSLEEQIAALQPQIKEAEEETRGVSKQLADIVKQLGGRPITKALRAELIGRESHLRAKELLLLTKELQLRALLLAAQQRRGASPFLFR